MSSRLAGIKNWVELGEKAAFKADKLALLCFVSPRQLERFFQHQFHTSPGRWLRELRCRRACQLVERGCPNKQAAADLKFGSETQFCHLFKKIVGTSPQMYAKSPKAASPSPDVVF